MLYNRVTGHNGHKPKRPQPKRPQTETATNRNGHKLERPQTGTATNRNGHKPERPQTGTATNRNGHKPKRPQTGTATNWNGHISCHQNKYDGESPIGNDDIHYKLHRNRSGDRPSSGSIMTISLVTHTVAGLGTTSWQCDRPRYDVAYVELITAFNIVGCLWNPQELMAISTRLCLQHTRWICRNFFQAMDWNEWLC